MKKLNKKSILLLIVAAIILTVSVVGTVAYLATATDPVVNTFTPGKTDTTIDEDFDKQTKSNVKITNAPDSIKVYVRAMVVANWCDEDGNIVAPWTDNIAYNTEDWIKGGDGYWYYKSPVNPGTSTDNLFDTYSYKSTEIPTGADHLEMTIIHQSVQADPTSAVVDFWGVTLDTDGTTIAGKTVSTAN